MRNLLFVFVLIADFVHAQDDTHTKWNHELELNIYTVDIQYYGGHELDYEIGRKFGQQQTSELGLKTGVFYARLRKNKQYSYIPVYLYYRYNFRNHNGSINLNSGTPVLWLQDDSKILSYAFWSADEKEEFSEYRKRIVLISQLEYEYYFNFGMGVSLGLTNYVTQVSNKVNSPAFDEVSYLIFPGFKLGLSYRF